MTEKRSPNIIPVSQGPEHSEGKAKQSRTLRIDARGILDRELNARLRKAVSDGTEWIELLNVNGQRYIGTGLSKPAVSEIFGTPGNDLGAFMNGSRIMIHGSAQDGCGNTMNSGEIIIHGRAGDI